MDKFHSEGASWSYLLPSPRTSVPCFSLTAVIASVLIDIIAKKKKVEIKVLKYLLHYNNVNMEKGMLFQGKNTTLFALTFLLLCFVSGINTFLFTIQSS